MAYRVVSGPEEEKPKSYKVVSGAARTEFEKPEYTGGLVERAGQFWSGDNRREFDLPDFDPPNSGAWQSLKAAGGLLAAPGNEQGKNVLAKNFPDANWSQDKFGNWIGETPDGYRGYANRPGVTFRDTISLAAQMALFAGVGGAAAGAQGATVGSTARVAGAEGATQAGIDIAGNLAGAERSDRDIAERSGIAALAGGTFEGLRPVFGKIYRTVAPKVKNVFRTVGGRRQLTDEAKKAFQDMGANLDDMTDDFVDMLAATADDIGDPAAAIRVADADTLPTPVPVTRGQALQDPAQQMWESQAGKGVYGERASRIMRGQDAMAQDALNANKGQIQGAIAGGVPQVVQRGQGASMVSQTLDDAATQARQGINQAYDAARASSAGVPGQQVVGGANRIAQAVAGDHHLPNIPKVAGLLDDLSSISSTPDQSVLVRSLFEWRKKATAARLSGGEESVALGKAVREFDNWMGGMVDDALMQGDDASVALWRDAIGKRREFGKMFQSGDLIEALTKQEFRGGQQVLKVAPEDAGNYIFGRSNLGMVGKKNLHRDLTRLKEVLGPDSAEWNALREEAWIRFASQGNGATNGMTAQFSGANFKKGWDSAWERDPFLMATLFSKSDKQLVDQFARTAAMVTNPVKGGANFSNTGAAIAGDAKRLVTRGLFGPRAAQYFANLPGVGGLLGEARGGAAALRATTPIPRWQPDPGVVQGMGQGALSGTLPDQ